MSKKQNDESDEWKNELTYGNLKVITKNRNYMLIGPNISFNGTEKQKWTKELREKLREFGIPLEASERIQQGGWAIVFDRENDNKLTVWTLPNDKPDCQCVLYKEMELSA